MLPFVANTDWNWFQFFRSTAPEDEPVPEANFWQPKAQKPMARLEPGTPVFFRLKSPYSAVAGYGFYSHFVLLQIEQAWDLFGAGNGDPDLARFLARIGRYRGADLLRDREARRMPLGCSILRGCVFWPKQRWLPWHTEAGWAPTIVQGRTEREPRNAERLLSELHYDRLELAPELTAAPFEPLEVDDRELVLARRRARVGQGTFRSRLLATYSRRCAITGEHTEPVLDAAHIQPYLGPASNHVQNGLLLTKEFHALFDEGYVTLTPELRVRVSPRLRRDWDNGHRYYPFDGKPLVVMPGDSERPSREALRWHTEHVYLD